MGRFCQSNELHITAKKKKKQFLRPFGTSQKQPMQWTKKRLREKEELRKWSNDEAQIMINGGDFSSYF